MKATGNEWIHFFSLFTRRRVPFALYQEIIPF